ncbi:MAG: AURKAIP1/COX24 domain-containing protein [Chloroflexota bacterium]
MSSVVKKRRKKITKHKLKKRLKRERFKRNR